MTTLEERGSSQREEGFAYVPPVETHLIRSNHVRQTFKVQVMQPMRKRGETVRFPVIYATDGNFAFDVLKGLSHSIQSFEHDAPRFILVGIGYPGDSPFAATLLRARDMTFPGYPELNLEPPPVEGTLQVEKGSRKFFGAEDFQRFIEDELFPLIDKHYETIPNDRTYYGHSLGGGFGLFTLFSKSHLFRNYLVSSPGLIYHGESQPGIRYDNHDFALEYARRQIASKRPLNNIKLYMSVGGEEEFEPPLAPWQLTNSFYRMASLLKAAAIPGLQLTTEVFPQETHMTVWPRAFIRGVQTVFGTGIWRKE
jgi:predicted alpha/beta superfamily hydrolase